MTTNNSTPDAATHWLTLPTRFSWWVLLATMLILIAASIGAKNLYFRGDYSIFFEDDNVQLRAFDEIQTTFAKSDNLAIVIAPESGTVFEPETLTLLQQITQDAWQIPFSNRVDSLANYQHTEAYQDDLIVEDLLLEDYPLTSERIEKIKQIALSEPVVKDFVGVT